MSSDRQSNNDDLVRLLGVFLRRKSGDKELGDALAEALQAENDDEPISPHLLERATAAAQRGMFDGAIARAKARITGSLGAFDSALVRVREEAKKSRAEMAERAGVSEALWTDLEDQRRAVDSVDVVDLAAVIEAAQLRQPEFRAAIKRSLSIRDTAAGAAAFRSNDGTASGSMAAYQDLLDAANEGTATDRLNAEAANDLADRISAELRHRRRYDLL